MGKASSKFIFVDLCFGKLSLRLGEGGSGVKVILTLSVTHNPKLFVFLKSHMHVCSHICTHYSLHNASNITQASYTGEEHPTQGPWKGGW